jgi:RNA polymerase sigma factor (sigma-70 family)
MVLPPVQFADLLARAREGDEDALRQVISEYEQEVHTVARIRLGTALRPYVDSVDLVQSVHRSMMVGLRDGKFDISTPQNLIALALTIVRRKVARQWRKVQRQQRLSGVDSSPGDLPDVLVGLVGKESDPAELASLRERTQRLWSELDPLERRVMELRMEGLSTADVARQLELDPDILRVRISRLRRRLRDLGIETEWI